jgi:hypothetical protein
MPDDAVWRPPTIGESVIYLDPGESTHFPQEGRDDTPPPVPRHAIVTDVDRDWACLTIFRPPPYKGVSDGGWAQYAATPQAGCWSWRPGS